MSRRMKASLGLLIFIILVTAISGTIIWQQSRVMEAMLNYTLSLEAEKYLLECRREEKNFHLRASMQSIQLFMTNQDSTNRIISRLYRRASDEEIKTNIDSLRIYLDGYQSVFKTMATARRNHSMGEDYISYMHLCTKIARECQLFSASIEKRLYEQYNLSNRTFKSTMIILIVSGAILSIFVAAYIMNEISMLIRDTPVSKK